MSFVPLAAPFLILLAAPRIEAALVAACWSVLILPGVLAINLFFDREHPFGRAVSRLAVASVAGLVPFAAATWLGCTFRWTLTTVLVVYAAFYVTTVAALAYALLRRGRHPSAEHVPPAAPAFDFAPAGPRWAAAALIACVALYMVGVCLASPPQPVTGNEAHPWRLGTTLAAVGSVLAAVLIVVGTRVRRDPVAAQVRPANSGASSSFDFRASRPRLWRPYDDIARCLVVLVWIAAAVMTWQVMRVSYTVATPQMTEHKLPWDVDDVIYVSAAVDYRHGIPLNTYEPSIGSDRGIKRADLSALVAPLVAGISRVTGVSCAALHHSIMPPLMILIGVSSLAGCLMAVLRGHRWGVPLGLVIVLMLVFKSWDHPRVITEFVVFRAMQTKSVHLLWVYPLQLATVVLLVTRPTGRHLALAAAVALVGHLVHPFATVLGAVWVVTVCLAALALNRKALTRLLLLATCYAALGISYKLEVRREPVNSPPASDRGPGMRIQSHDLARVGDAPIMRQDLNWAFGRNTLFNAGALAVPMVLALGWRRRELLCVGLIGAVALACCTITPLGNLLNVALPTAIMWRARWLVPCLVNVAIVGVVLYGAFVALLGTGSATRSALVSLLASLLAGGGFCAMLAQTDSLMIRTGPEPTQLSKFSQDMHDLVDVLGGVEAAPFVWGPRRVQHTLPQLMPHVRLVLSRSKVILPADHPEFREVALSAFRQFRDGTITADTFRELTQLYPIEYVVIDRRSRAGAAPEIMLGRSGWQPVGGAGRYVVWRAPQSTRS